MSNLSQSQVNNIIRLYQTMEDTGVVQDALQCTNESSGFWQGSYNATDCPLFALQYATVLTLMADNKTVEHQVRDKTYLNHKSKDLVRQIKQEFNDAADQACAILGPAGLSSPDYCQEPQPSNAPWWYGGSSGNNSSQWQSTTNFAQQTIQVEKLLLPCTETGAQISEQACSSAGGAGLCRWSPCKGVCENPLKPPQDCSKQ